MGELVPLERITKGRTTQGGTARRLPPFFRTKKVGLLGATENLAYAPWFDTSWTLAAHPCCRPSCGREPDWYFDLHRPECFRMDKSWNPKYFEWLQKLQTPIFMQENWPDIPMAVRYPKERIFGEFRQYFTNHCAYMIALAMTEGVTHIGLFGCQYSGGERGTQRDSLSYWLGRFEQAGGTIVIPPAHNTLLTKPLYGYESHDEHGKLIAAYRVPPVIKKAGASLVLEAPSTVELMPHPHGEEPAYARAEALFGPTAGAPQARAATTPSPVPEPPRETDETRSADCPADQMVGAI